MKKTKFNHTFEYFALLFFVLAVGGWLWEVLLSFFAEHTFVNRGVYQGPYLPVYGIGGLLICLLLRSFRKKPVKAFVLSALLCSVLEYLTSCLLEKRWGLRWWDYSGHFCNINGRICLVGAVAFGLGGMLLVCLALPLYDRAYKKMPQKWRTALCILLLLIFAADAAYCAMRPNMGPGVADPVQTRLCSGSAALYDNPRQINLPLTWN